MTIDRDLVKHILAAEQPRHMAFVTGHSNQLKLARNAVSAEDLKAMKGAAGGSPAVFKGRAVLEKKEGETPTLVCYLQPVAKTLEQKIKRAIKENAGLGRAVRVLPLSEFKSRDEEQEQPVPPEGGEEVEEVSPLKAEYDEMFASVKDDLVALRQVNTKVAAKLEPKLDEAIPKTENDKGYKAAMKALAKIGKVANKALGKTTDEQKAVAEKAAYKSLRDRLAATAEGVKTHDPDIAKRIERYITDAEALVGDDLDDEEKNYKAATKILLKLDAYLQKNLRKIKKTNDGKLTEQFEDAVIVAGDYESKYREARADLKVLTTAYPRSRVFPTLAAKLDEAAEHARVYHYDQAMAVLDPAREQLAKALLDFQKYNKHRNDFDVLFNQAAALTQPRLPPERLQHFRVFRQQAEQLAGDLTLDAAGAGLLALANEVRTALSERLTFLEAYRECTKLLNQAEEEVDDNTFGPWEGRFLRAADLHEVVGGSPAEAYNLITALTAEIRQALRQVEAKKESGSRVSDVKEGKSRLDRRVRFQLHLDGARKGLLVIAKHRPDVAKDLQERLNKVIAAREKGLLQAGGLLDALLADIKKAMEEIRSHLQPGEWEHPEDAPPPAPPISLTKWKSDIDHGMLTKVKVGKKLGEGGFGGVFRLDLDDQHQGEEVLPLVIKIPPPNDNPDLTEEDKLAEIRKEAELYEKLGEHPNLLKCLGVRQVNGQQGLVMERVRGKTTDEFYKNLRAQLSEGKLTEPEFWSTVQYTMSKMLGAVAYMHSKGFAHNDLKPQNIMIDEVTGDVKVIDVGTANLLGEVVGNNDSPYFQAPEQLKKQGSSSQTDAMPIGGVAYSGLTGEKSFHHGNSQGMLNSFLTKVEEVVTAYGDRRGEEAEEGAIGLSTEQETVRRVNVRGEDDPEGEIRMRDLSKTPAQSAFTEFMNLLMHPDPSKRLSPSQALEHPFLRDSILSEDQVRAIVQRPSEDTKEGTQDEQRRKLLASLQSDLANYTRDVAGAREGAHVDPATVAPGELLAQRATTLKLLQTLDANRIQIQRRIDALTPLIAGARLKTTKEFFQDNRDLASLQQLARESDELRPVLVRVGGTLGVSIQRGGQQVGKDVTLEQVEKRVKDLETERAAVAKAVTATINTPVPTLLAHCEALQALQEQVEGIQDNSNLERQLLLRLSYQRQSPEALKRLAHQLSEHLKQLTPIVDQLKVARGGPIKELEEAYRKVSEELVPEFGSLREAFDNKHKLHEQRAQEYEAVVRAPRDTTEALAAFEEARVAFEAYDKEYRDGHAEIGRTLEEQRAQAIRLQKQLGDRQVSGLPDPLTMLRGLLTDLSVLRSELTR